MRPPKTLILSAILLNNIVKDLRINSMSLQEIIYNIRNLVSQGMIEMSLTKKVNEISCKATLDHFQN